MKRTVLLAVALTFAACTSLYADQTFTDQATFESTVICNDSISSDFFPLGPAEQFDEFELPIQQPFGSFDFRINLEDSTLNPPFLIVNDDVQGLVAFEGQTEAIVLTPDLSNGEIVGFGFFFDVINTNALSTDTEISITIIDTDGNIAETFTAIDPLDEPSFDTFPPNLAFFGWQNCNNIDVGSIEFAADASIFVSNGSICFGQVVEEDPTAQSCIEDVIDSINAIIPTASELDQAFLNEAVYQLMSSLDPSLWATEDRLSSYGTQFFSNVFNATYLLECTSDPAAVEDIQNSLQDCLALIVQNEIDFALENPYVNNNLLVYSEFFESSADVYSDAGFFLEAVLLHFYAWLFAFWA